MSASTASALPVFSYAQAAKGLTPATSTQATPRNESPAASEKSNKDRLNQDLALPPAAKPSPPRSEGDECQHAQEPLIKQTDDRNGEPPSQESQQPPLLDQPSKAHDTHVTADIDSQTKDARPPLQNGRASSAEQVHSLSGQDKSATGTSDKKSKDVEDDWEKISVPSVNAEKELKAAPIPTVNFWKARQEAQAAKIKEVAEQQRTTFPAPAAPSTKSKPGIDEHKRKPSTKDLPVVEKDNRAADVARNNSRKDTAPSRSSRPVSQHGEKRNGDLPPSVGDTHSWPTPEGSTGDERRKSSSYEKVDKPDGKVTAQKSHGKSWISVPFVPSAKFETQLPPSAARRGGRGSNRGARDGGGRGGQSTTAAEKQEPSGLMGPPPIPKQSSDQDRGRKSDGQRGQRGASVPTSSTRPLGGDEDGSTADKAPTSINKDQNSTENTVPQSPGAQHGEEQLGRTTHSSRSSSTYPVRPAAHAGSEKAPHQDDHINSSGQPLDANDRQASSFDKFKASAPISGAGAGRGHNDYSKDRTVPRSREWSRDKPDSAREKVESWRDRESPNDQNGRRENRSERGGRGSYRGRGGNHSYNSTFGPFTSPLPQNGFDPTRSNSHTESRSRQSSQPFLPAQSPGNPRQNPRSQSIPVQMMVPNYFQQGPNVPQGLPPLQTDMYGYPQMHMPPGIMSAMPYNDPLNQLALMSMVVTQIEYYFSIDNLCKDVFLRKHMDGQGWVPLSIIANFKRIKTLTEDNMSIDTLRYVCQTVKTVEYLPGVDGDDRLRRRDNWRDFVLPPDERFESARHDGPVNVNPAYPPVTTLVQDQLDNGYTIGQVHSPSMGSAAPNGLPTSPPSFIPGPPPEHQAAALPFPSPFLPSLNETDSRYSLANPNSNSSATAVRSPEIPSSASIGTTVNGHHRHSSRSDMEAVVFPDENIPNINIRMQPRNLQAPVENGPVDLARITSNDSTSSSRNLDQQRIPSLRGGAGNVQQLDHLRNMSFGLSNGIPTKDEASVIYFTKDGQETHLPPPRPGQYDQTYLSLHEVAFQQKQLGVEGALEPLYSFWTDFLVDKFNAGMYQEFKSAALSEAEEGSTTGITHLTRYYTKLLSGVIPISERVASDMVSVSRDDKRTDRPLFQILRAAWRNGATNMKTIKRLGDKFTPEEKAILEKSG